MMPPRSVRHTLYLLHGLFIDLCLHHTAAKRKFINDAGLVGFAMWQTGGDSDDILLDAIRGTGTNC